MYILHIFSKAFVATVTITFKRI